MAYDSDDEIGYGKPPKRTRFKKGQSGCPDGGWQQRRAKLEAKRTAEEERKQALEKNIAPAQFVEDHFTKPTQVTINGGPAHAARMELLFRMLDEEVFVKKNPVFVKMYLDMLRQNGWLKAPPPARPGAGVLVVYAIPTVEAWIKQTEGELLPKDPLHGTSYQGGPLTKRQRGKSYDDEDR